MRRLVASLFFVMLASCAYDAEADLADPPPPAAPSTVVDSDPTTLPRLSIGASTSDLSNPAKPSLRVKGTLENSKLPGRFRLRMANGCTRDAQIDTTTVGTAFTLALHEAELADAFACVVDAEVGDTTLASVTVTPDAEVDLVASSPSLHIETFSVASIDLEPPPHGGQTVRIAVISTAATEPTVPTLSILGTTIKGLTSPAEDVNPTATRITFEVPSRLWARASINGKLAVVTSADARLELRPTARVELLGDDDAEADCDDDGC